MESESNKNSGNSRGYRTMVYGLGLLILLIGIPLYVGTQLVPGNPLLVLTASLIAGFFLFNLTVRHSLSFEGYFTSPFNVFTSKAKETIVSDLQRELLFAKLTEVLVDSKFRLIKADRGNYRILAITGISWLSWGENLYIRLEPIRQGTAIRFCSSTLFQVHSWNKNKDNFRLFVEDFERSLTI